MENKILTKEFNKYIDQMYNLDKINVEVYTEFKKAFFVGGAIVLNAILISGEKGGNMDDLKHTMHSLNEEIKRFAYKTNEETKRKNNG